MKHVDIAKLTWCDAKSEVVDFAHVLECVSTLKDKREIHVGCDSHFVGTKCIFAIVIALYEKGKGGTYFFARIKKDRKLFHNLKIRLLKETEYSIALAGLLEDRQEKVCVHLDINPNEAYKSNVVFTSATAWVKSLGYQCVVKPDSWASSWLADAYAK